MKKTLITISVYATPFLALAQGRVNSIWDIFTMINSVLNRLVPLFIGLAVVWFIWNVFRYAIAGDEDKKKEAKVQIIWGIVAIFIMVSVWGLVNILINTFGTGGVAPGNVGGMIPGF